MNLVNPSLFAQNICAKILLGKSPANDFRANVSTVGEWIEIVAASAAISPTSNQSAVHMAGKRPRVLI
jgi:hypothetical protein